MGAGYGSIAFLLHTLVFRCGLAVFVFVALLGNLSTELFILALSPRF